MSEEMDFSVSSVLHRMRSSLKAEANKMEGGFCMDNLQAVAEELARMDAMEVKPIPDKVLLDTAEGEYLDRKALDYNETRNPATSAAGTLVFTGDVGVTIPLGTVAVNGALCFETTAPAQIGKSGICEVGAKCQVAGAEGNVPIDTITSLRSNISGVKSVTNPAPFGGGTEAESDVSFRSRILDKIRLPITSGNRNHYIYWAKQVSGVGGAKCLGAEVCGTRQVRVIVLSSHYGVPDNVVLGNVAAHIEEERPVGAEVMVAAATPLEVSIMATVKLANGYQTASIQQNIWAALQKYIDSVNKEDFNTPPFCGDEHRESQISFYRIGDLIFGVDGVDDILSYTLNGGSASLTAAYQEYFALVEVRINGG